METNIFDIVSSFSSLYLKTNPNKDNKPRIKAINLATL